jgi:SM-20-related protein
MIPHMIPVQTHSGLIDLAAVEISELQSEPFPYLIERDFIPAGARAAILADYPTIERPGSYPVADLIYGPAFAQFLADLDGPEMRATFERKFGVDLAGRPTMVTLRGQAQPSDGRIHTDTASKIITVLIYMNEAWEASGGRLRLLRSNASLDDVAAEVPPLAGTLLAFLVTPNSWHGHYPTRGPRRVVQFNWVQNDAVVRRERLRHGLSAGLKRLLPRQR